MALSFLLTMQTRVTHRTLCHTRRLPGCYQMLSYRPFRLNPNSSTVVTNGPEVRNFSELTLEWIIDSAESHMKANEDSYEFCKEDVKLVSDEATNGKTLISCTAQNTSQWLINRMLSHQHFVHSFTKSADFQPLKHLFKISADAEPSMNDGIMTLEDKSNNICIEQTKVTEIGTEWMHSRGYIEYFDVIFDELAVDNIISNEYVKTTIYGHCLKRGAVIYVSHRRFAGDIAGRKLRSKISGLYPNSHFELIAERDAAWVTQFLFLKALNCSQENLKRESDRKDDWGDGHLSYNQSAIWEQSKLTAQAGRGVNAPEGIYGVVDILKKEGPGIAGQFKKDDIRETLGV